MVRPRAAVLAPVLLAVAAPVLLVVALVGCSNRTRLLRTASVRTVPPATASTPAPQGPPAHRAYLDRLNAEQDRLARAEVSIPTGARTPAALAHSAALLAAAIGRLGDGLAAIRPPPPVAADHARLIAIVRGYAGQLREAAAMAGRPGGVPAADRLLDSSTLAASASFSATVARIHLILRG